MSGMLKINLSRPVKTATVINDQSGVLGGEQFEANIASGQLSTAELDAQKAVFVKATQVLNGVVEKLSEFCDKMFAGHKEEIAHLSVEIARKILMYKVEKGDYEIESIVKKALENAPGREEIAVHLHPDDLAQCQKAQEDEPNGALAGIKFVSDSNIARAECLLESPKGIVKSLIDENLERIAMALKNG
jgi:flagellar biosynthesis/type III secretory pathway protein FliH